MITIGFHLLLSWIENKDFFLFPHWIWDKLFHTFTIHSEWKTCNEFPIRTWRLESHTEFLHALLTDTVKVVSAFMQLPLPPGSAYWACTANVANLIQNGVSQRKTLFSMRESKMYLSTKILLKCWLNTSDLVTQRVLMFWERYQQIRVSSQVPLLLARRRYLKSWYLQWHDKLWQRNGADQGTRMRHITTSTFSEPRFLLQKILTTIIDLWICKVQGQFHVGLIHPYIPGWTNGHHSHLHKQTMGMVSEDLEAREEL